MIKSTHKNAPKNILMLPSQATDNPHYTLAALYRFVPVTDPLDLKSQLYPFFKSLNLFGTLLIAPEGINGTLAGSDRAIETMLTKLQHLVGLDRQNVKLSYAPEIPFHRLKVRLKRELITFKQPNADPSRLVGTYVNSKEWNDLLHDPEVIVVDTRNIYETLIGKFKGALDPRIERFTDFAAYVQQNLDPRHHKKIAMYCTGGIRCEKASSYMRAQGFENVYHLKGGILKYLEEISPEDSAWQGECYVFDRRMSVGHGLKPGSFTMCFCCGYPLSEDDKQHRHYEAGVSCGYCHSQSSQDDKARFRNRHQQMQREGRV